MAKNLFTIQDGKARGRLFILGLTGRGRSRLLEAEAERLGLSYEDLLLRMEPTPEQKAKALEQAEERRRRAAIRLAAVRQAYWDATVDPESEFAGLADAVASITGASLSREQLQRVFLTLPADIIGQGIAWGFGDTEVREMACMFAKEHVETVLAVIVG